MKKLIIISILACFIIFLPQITQAQTEEIDDFDVDIMVNQDSSLTVTEKLFMILVLYRNTGFIEILFINTKEPVVIII